MSTIDPGRPFRGRARGGGRHGGRREPRPRPLGDKCNPLCPFFRCSQRALRITTETFRGRPIKVAMCAWIGDKCIGASCRMAYCEKRAMLPDGRCAFAVRAKTVQRDFEEDIMELEKEAKKFGIDEDYF